MSGFNVNFDSSSTTGSPLSYSWNFGDGTATTPVANPVHAFQHPGSYQVTLTVTATDGTTSTATHSIFVGNLPPTAEFSTASVPRLSQPVEFANESFDLDSRTPPSYSWDFGDGTSSTSANPAHQYATPGQKTVTLTVTDDLGATDSVSHVITVADDGVTANITFAPATPQVGQAVTFDGHASSSQGIDGYKWTFDDGTISTAVTPTHVFTTAGDHTVQLEVTNDAGVKYTTSATVPVQAPSGGGGEPGGDPGSGDPGPGDPGSGSPGSGDPGPGNPGPGDPGSGGPGTGGPGSGGGGDGDPNAGGTPPTGDNPAADPPKSDKGKSKGKGKKKPKCTKPKKTKGGKKKGSKKRNCAKKPGKGKGKGKGGKRH